MIECKQKVMFAMEMYWKSQLDFLIPSRSCAVMQHSTRDLRHKHWATWTTIQTLQSVIQRHCVILWRYWCLGPTCHLLPKNAEDKDYDHRDNA